MDGKHVHHIVEQSQIGKSNIPAQQIHNTNNTILLDSPIHGKITGHYNRGIIGFSHFRDSLVGTGFIHQYQTGIDVLAMYGVFL
ncbi:MAG: hypothetical protein LBK69_03490 [Syntrophomonadaceae bacterium]|nr:hypothetical protein [Syntrophomonadaceae bacterium]